MSSDCGPASASEVVSSDQAEGWERLAAEEAYLMVCNSPDGDEELHGIPCAEARWDLRAAA